VTAAIDEGSRSYFGEHFSSNTSSPPSLFWLSLSVKIAERLRLTKKELAAVTAATAAAAATRLDGTKHQRLGIDAHAHSHSRDLSSKSSFITYVRHTVYKRCVRLSLSPPGWRPTCQLLLLLLAVGGCTRKSTGLDLHALPPLPPSLSPSRLPTSSTLRTKTVLKAKRRGGPVLRA